MKKLTPFILILLLVASFVSAHEGAYTLSATGSSSTALCPRDTGLFVSKVVNTDTHEQQYTLAIRGSASSWTTSVPGGFLLAPGKEKTVYTYVTPSRDASPGDYDLDVVFTTNGESETQSYKVKVNDCYQSDLSSSEDVKAVCPGEVTKFTLRIENTGAYREDYILRVEGGLKEDVKLSDDIVSLASGEDKKVYAYVTPPKEVGEYGFSVIAQGSSGRSVQSINHIVNVRGCYDFDVDLDGKNSYQFCERTINQADIEIKNEGTTTNTYRLDIDGPRWAQLEDTEVTLLAGAKTDITLLMAPDYGVQGDFSADISIVPERGENKANTEIKMNVRKCHSVDVNLLQNQVQTCNNGREAIYEALIVNDGEVDKEYSLEVKGPAWVTTDAENTFELAAGEEKKIQIIANPGQDAREGDYDVLVKVNATDDSAVTVFDSDVLELEAVGTDKCYEPVLGSQYEDVVVYFDSAVVVPVTVQNIGLETADYELVLSGDAVSFSRIAPGVLTVEPGRTETAFIYIAPGPQSRLGGYELGVSAKLVDSTILASRKLDLRVTDVEAEATPLEKLQEEQNELTGAAVGADGGAWTRFKAWIKALFSPAEPLEDATEDTEEVGEEVADTSMELEEADTEMEEIQMDLEETPDSEDAEDTSMMEEGEMEETVDVELEEGTTTMETEQEEVAMEEVTGETTKDNGAIANFINNNRYWILGLIILILILIVLARLDAGKKLKAFYYDEIDDDDDE